MTTFKRLWISLLVASAIYALFSWPIPRYITQGIPAGSYNIEKGAARAMMPGDHLQLLYQFWLTGDTLAGRTEPFVNPYEFNVGNDADGAFRGTYYAPFSLFYTIAAPLGGRAFGYNFSHFVTIWITFLFAWLLVQRYNRDPVTSGAAAVIAAALPYPWITMLDGSPTGFGMMWMPMIVWALDILVAERKLWAGAVAGIAICLAESDSHVFFYCLLSLPVWCGLSYLYHFPGRWPSRSEVLSLLKASTLLFVFLGVAVWEVWIIRYSIQDTNLAGATRTVEEVRANSPILSGLVRIASIGEGRKIYVGGYLIALLSAGFGAFLWSRRREKDKPSFPPLLPVLFIGLGIVAVALLSTGTMNPFGPRAWKLLVKLVPPYGMIRQPHKVYCLMPVLLALMTGLVLPILLRSVTGRRRLWAVILLVLPFVLDYGVRVKATVCLVDREQLAFKAIADDARAAGNPRPHLLSLPVWPGDSHYDSRNEHYVSLYRLRMVNGYGGTVRESYRTNIFDRLETMNVGEVNDAQLDLLMKRGVGYLVVHEDSFPEKVSPFPIGQMLESLLNAPRLMFLKQDGPIWSFKILPAEQAVSHRPAVSMMQFYCPTRRFDIQNLRGQPPKPYVNLPPSLVCSKIPAYWWIRMRGEGPVQVAAVMGSETNAPVTVAVSSRDWTWKKVAIPLGAGPNGVGAKVVWDDQAVNLDTALLMTGEWGSPAPGQSVALLARNFFHAGYSDGEGAVILRAAREPDAVVFYGPKLPIEPGRYSAELVFESPAPAGTLLGEMTIRWADGPGGLPRVPVRSGARAVAEFEQKENVPFNLAFQFLREGDMRIRKVVLRRLSGEPK